MSNKSHNHSSPKVRIPSFIISLKTILVFATIISAGLITAFVYFNFNEITEYVTSSVESVLMWTGLGVVLISFWMILTILFIKSH